MACFHRKEGASEKKSAKAGSAGKAGKNAERTPKAPKSVAAAKEPAADPFGFDEEGEEPAAKKQKATPAAKGGICWGAFVVCVRMVAAAWGWCCWVWCGGWATWE